MNSSTPSTSNIDEGSTRPVPGRRKSGFRPKTIRDVRREQAPEPSEPEKEPSDATSIPGVPAVQVPAPEPRRTLPVAPKRVTAKVNLPAPSTPPASPEAAAPAAPAATAGDPSTNSPALPSIFSHPRFKPATIAVLALTGFLFVIAGTYRIGLTTGRIEGKRETTTALKNADAAKPVKADPLKLAPTFFPEHEEPQLSAALRQLRTGDPVDAWNTVKSLIEKYPTAPSLRYAAAMAAMQAEYYSEAEKILESSLALRDRISDAYALKAAISGIRSRTPGPEQENLLRKAIAADPMNPNSFVELASYLRYQNRLDEALALLEAARVRLLPVDSHSVVATTLALVTLQKTPDDQLPEPAELTNIPEKDIPTAYIQMRKGNFEAAATTLKSVEKILPPELFAYLVDDPALRKYAKQAELVALYR